MSTPAKDTQTPKGSEQTVDWEKRYKDQQKFLVESRTELKAAKAKVEVLSKLTQPKLELDEATLSELEELKFSDPDAWRAKVNKLENEALIAHRASLSQVEQQAAQEAEMERRAQVLADFNQRHPELQITDDVINFDVPPRFTKKLELGEISFDDFLVEVGEYLSKPKVIGSANKTLGQPNLSKTGGDDTPTKGAIEQDIIADYGKNKVIF